MSNLTFHEAWDGRLPGAWLHVQAHPPAPVAREGFRPLRGSANCNALLTEDDVREMRRLAAEGWSYARIARRFGVVKETAGAICRRQAWRHVE